MCSFYCWSLTLITVFSYSVRKLHIQIGPLHDLSTNKINLSSYTVLPLTFYRPTCVLSALFGILCFTCVFWFDVYCWLFTVVYGFLLPRHCQFVFNFLTFNVPCRINICLITFLFYLSFFQWITQNQTIEKMSIENTGSKYQ